MRYHCLAKTYLIIAILFQSRFLLFSAQRWILVLMDILSFSPIQENTILILLSLAGMSNSLSESHLSSRVCSDS